jgi:hypothetical protein
MMNLMPFYHLRPQGEKTMMMGGMKASDQEKNDADLVRAVESYQLPM